MVRPFSLLAVATVAVIFVYAAPPLGYILDLGNVEILVATLIGTTIGSFFLVYAGAWISRAFIRGVYRVLDKPVPESSAPPQWMRDVTERFGAPGLGLLAPFTIGGLAAALLGPALGVPKRRLAIWLAIGSAVMVTAYTLLVGYAVTTY